MISGIFKVGFDVFSPALFLCRVLTDDFISSLRARKHFREANQLLCLVGVIFSLVCSSPAQVDRAGLSGRVTDPSGSLLPQTHVTVVHDSTGLQRETTSSSSGTYDIAELPVGVHTVTFSHDGFQTLTLRNVIQTVGQTRKRGLVFSSNGDGSLTILSQAPKDRYEPVQTLSTRKGARTMALDAATGTLYLVTADLAPTPAPTDQDRPSIAPNAFVVLEVGQ